MKKTKMIALALCTGLLLTGCGKIPTLANGEQVVAKLDGKEFTADQLYLELKSLGGNQVLTDMIDDYIASKEIEDTTDAEEYATGQVQAYKEQMESYGYDYEEWLAGNGFADEASFKDYMVKSYLKQQAVEKYVKNHLTDQEINEYYENEVFGELTAKHILIAPETTSDMTDEEISAAENAAYEKAKKLIADLNNGADWDTVVKENTSDTGSADDGGLISNFSKDSFVEEFWNATYALKDGEMTAEPVKSSYGYHIIVRVSQNEKPTKEQAMDTIKDSLYNKKANEDQYLYQKTWVELRKAYNLEIIDSDIKSAYNDTVKDYE